jgi:hypothetical protein
MTEALFSYERGAVLSPCRRYRYHLWRAFGNVSHRCVFVGLNPSTADENLDDPTIRKCVGFAKRWGFGAIDMLNLFAWRSTDPNGLLEAEDPIGPDNQATAIRVLGEAHRIVWCWGHHNARIRKLVHARTLDDRWIAIPKACDAGTFGRNQGGSPRHPLMLAYTTRFESSAPVDDAFWIRRL